MSSQSFKAEVPSAQKNTGIQFLRALAVVSVIVFHLDESFLPGGFVGVDIFFVISGFVITQSLLRQRHKSLLFFLRDFYGRRVLRILPALLVFLAVAALAIAFFVPRGFFLGGDAPQTGRWAVFGLSNVSLYFSDRGYFDERIPFNVFAHTWSLGVEEQFYLILPLLLWLSVALGKRRFGLRGNLIGLLLLGLPIFTSLAYSYFASLADPLAAFYLIPSRFWELGFGVLLAFGLPMAGERSRQFLQKWRKLAVLLGLGMVLGALTSTQSSGFPFPAALLPVMGTTFLLLGFWATREGERNTVRKVIELRAIQALGNWSYSLYLWHWGVIVLMRWTVGLAYWWHFVLALGLTVLAGWLSYRYVETPFLRGGQGFHLRPKRVLAAAAAISMVWASALWLGDRATEPIISLSVTAQREVFSPPTGTEDPEERFSSFEGIGRGHSLFVVGDSHAGHLGTLITELRAVMGFDFRQFEDRHCRLANFALERGSCEEWETTLSLVEEAITPGDVVLLSSLRVPRITSLSDGQVGSTADVVEDYLSSISSSSSANALNEAREVILRLANAGAIVVVPTPTPVFPSPMFRCLDWFNQMNPVCQGGFSIERETMQALAAPALENIRSLETDGLVVVWDSFSELCPAPVCESSMRGRQMFYDGDHLSDWGNYVLMPSFANVLSAQWGSEETG